MNSKMKITSAQKILIASGICTLLSSCTKIDPALKGKYTYRTTTSIPSTWNPTDWTLNNEGDMISYLSTGLYDFVLNDTKDGHKIICEMASEFPEDVTAQYAGNKTYGIPSDATSGYAWKIHLNPLPTWDDGTPINAYTYEYSLKQFLNPKMKNYRASSYYQDSTALANAQDYYEGKTTWDKVGFIVDDEYCWTMILANPTTQFMMEYNLSGNFLLKEDLYEANKKQTGDIIKSSYCTSVDTSASYGPYILTLYQEEKEIEFQKNPAWYGWTDGRHEGQYQTTGINMQIIDKHTTILSLFMQGKLDEVGLTAEDLKRYGNSQFRLESPQSYTIKLSFNIDRESLKKEDSPGINHSIISYLDFRKGFSLALDRQAFVNTLSPASEPGYGLINNSYIADPQTMIRYRDTPQAKQALCQFYETQTVEDITGYNLKEAKVHFQKAYDSAVKNGDLKPNDKIVIDLHTYNADDSVTKLVDFMNSVVQDGTSGTSLEGKVSINQVTDEDYYNNMQKGNVDLALTAWGGSTMDPYGILWCYCDPEASNEFGFNPEKELLTIRINDKNLTKTFFNWYMALCNGQYATASSDIKNTILANVERGLLEYYNMIPIRYMTSIGLNSQRIIEGSQDFINSIIGRGGIRHMTYSMDDYQWEVYCKDNKYKLLY